jgi:hypothetical protein
MIALLIGYERQHYAHFMCPSACQPKADGSPRVLHFLGLTKYTVNALNSDIGHVARELDGCRSHERSQEGVVSEREIIAERHDMFRYKIIETNTGQNKSILEAVVRLYFVSRGSRGSRYRRRNR